MTMVSPGRRARSRTTVEDAAARKYRGKKLERIRCTIVLDSLDEAPALADRIAAEHLEIATANAEESVQAHPQCWRDFHRSA